MPDCCMMPVAGIGWSTGGTRGWGVGGPGAMAWRWATAAENWGSMDDEARC